MQRDCLGDPIDVGDLVRWRQADRCDYPSVRMFVTWVAPVEHTRVIRVIGDSGIAETVLSDEVVVIAKGGQ